MEKSELMTPFSALDGYISSHCSSGTLREARLSKILSLASTHDAGANFRFSDQCKVYLERALSAASRGTRAIDGPPSQVLNKHLELAAEDGAAGTERGPRPLPPPPSSHTRDAPAVGLKAWPCLLLSGSVRPSATVHPVLV